MREGDGEAFVIFEANCFSPCFHFCWVRAKSSKLPSQTHSLPMPPTHAKKLQQSYMHTLAQSHKLTYTPPQNLAPTHSLIHTHTHSHSCAHSYSSHSHTWAQTGVRTHSYTQWHAYSCTHIDSPKYPLAHTFPLHAHINATHPPSYSHIITYAHSLTCILAHICKYILEHTRRHPGFFPRRESEMSGIFQQKMLSTPVVLAQDS